MIKRNYVLLIAFSLYITNIIFLILILITPWVTCSGILKCLISPLQLKIKFLGQDVNVPSLQSSRISSLSLGGFLIAINLGIAITLLKSRNELIIYGWSLGSAISSIIYCSILNISLTVIKRTINVPNLEGYSLYLGLLYLGRYQVSYNQLITNYICLPTYLSIISMTLIFWYTYKRITSKTSNP